MSILRDQRACRGKHLGHSFTREGSHGEEESVPGLRRPGRSLDRRDFLRTVGVTAAAAATAGVPLFAVPQRRGRPDADQRRRDRRQGPLRHADRRAEEEDLLRLGLQGPEARPAAHARLEQLADHQAAHPQRLLHQGAAGDHPRHLQGDHQPRVVRASSSSSSRTTPAASRGARTRASPSSASRAATSSSSS